MDPITLGVLAAIAIGIVALLVTVFVVRAWIRTLKMMMKLAFYGFVTLLVLAAGGAGVAYFLYGDQIRAMLAG
ncbi:MAG: hypothetical protein H6737_28045 [Alphaproteobacteria bacterium]|nr:hypothetical protein [Alphaproteobacteria bacterium]